MERVPTMDQAAHSPITSPRLRGYLAQSSIAATPASVAEDCAKVHSARMLNEIGWSKQSRSFNNSYAVLTIS
jgi:hypothetical protein